MNIQQLLASALTVFIAIASFAQTNPPVVKTNAGSVSGTARNGLYIFKGIPFAAPPVGDLRWKAPQPVQPWSGIKQCDTFSASPMQTSPAPFSMWSEEFLIRKEPISEDCLYLNVWTSATSSPNKKLPVLVWIYGGGFNSGGSNVPIYDGEAMAKKGIVFVSPNYRVGIFGFFAHPELSKEAPYHASGNYGILDQIAALKWVQQNIAAFGGDPNNVTVAGQSAGSMSVNTLVASPLAKGLFNKAIAESGAGFINSFGSTNLQQAEEAGVKTATSLKANSIEGLRKLPAAELMKAQSQRGVIIDGYVLPQPIAAIFAANKENKVALLTGWNENEGLMFGAIKNAADYKKQMEQQYGSNAQMLLKYYPATDDASASASQYDLSRDLIFGVQNFTWANITAGKGNKVYVYRFARKVPGTGEYAKYGAFHTGEVPYAYNNLKFVNRPWMDVDNKLAEAMSACWANFIKTGNPNGNDLPAWKPYSTNNREIMVLGDTQQSMPMADAARLDVLYSILKAQ